MVEVCFPPLLLDHEQVYYQMGPVKLVSIVVGGH
jgi:hypothetical protein